MKIYKYIILVFLVGLFSCEEFLEENFVSGNSTEAHYTSAEGMETLINSCYAFLKIFYGKEEGFDFSAIGTDIYDYGQQHNYQFQFMYESEFDPSHSRNVILWVVFYKGVNACNDAIDVLKDPENTPFDEEHTNVRLAEVRFLRALYNYLIVETWGGVEVRDEAVRGVIKNAERKSTAEFYTLILGDLDEAVAKLRQIEGANTAATDYGRVTLNAALALRARARLTYASEYYTNDGALALQAAQDAQEVINSGDFTLYDNYADVWDIANEGPANQENIWSIVYSYSSFAGIGLDQAQLQSYQRPGDKLWEPRDGGHHGHLMFGSQYDVVPGMVRDLENGRPFRRYTPTMYLIDSYHQNVDERFDGTFKSVWFANAEDTTEIWDGGPKLAPGDTCIVYTTGLIDDALQTDTVNSNYWWNLEGNYWCMDHDNMFNADGTTNTEESNERNICLELQKFMDPNRAAANGAGSERGGRDHMVLRLSEMYLIAAEGYWRGGQAGQAYTAMTQLANARAADGVAGTAMLADYGINSGGDFTMDFFMDERARELCGEQIRWFDMKRLGADNMVSRMKQYAGNTEARDNFDAHFVLRPIPQIQIDALIDKSTFPQNPGYGSAN